VRRGHRSAHRRLWPILLLVVGIGFAMALYLRPAPAQVAPVAAETAR